jgi:hypothetical protein
MFLRRLAKLLKDNPPYPADSGVMTKLKLLGIEPGKDFDPDKLDPQVRKGINEAPWNVWKLLAEGPYTMSTVNGWVNMTNLGRYGTDYNTRALIAYAGLGALTSDDAVYPKRFHRRRRPCPRCSLQLRNPLPERPAASVGQQRLVDFAVLGRTSTSETC